MEPNVSYRLRTIAGMVPDGSVVCDVGCDHGLLPVYLLKNGIINKAIAMDVNKGPLEGARENVRAFGLSERVDIRLSDGLDALRPGEADCIVIAGMGGQLMKEILIRGRSVWEEADTVILSPHRDEVLIREYMSDLCQFKDDAFVYEDGHFYTMMVFKPKCVAERILPKNLEFGLNPPSDYLSFKASNYEKVLRNLKDRAKTDDIIRRSKEINEKLLLINKFTKNI